MKKEALKGESENTVQQHNCCQGGRFWFWASIRITIVIGLIIGAYCLGSYMNPMWHTGTDNSYPNRRGTMQGMMNSPKNRIQVGTGSYRNMMSMNMTEMSMMLQGKTGDDLNRAFLEMMIPHHQGAIDMAKYLAASNKPELIKLGADIISAQTKEIEQMKKWQIDWGYITTGATSHNNMMMR